MIGKIIGAFVGDRLASKTSSIGGASGAALGVVATSVLSRLSLPAMLVLGAGGYAAKRFLDKKDGETTSKPTPVTPATKPVTDLGAAPRTA